MSKNDIFDETLQNSEEIEDTGQKHLKFQCPNCGNISQEDVIFICNRCDTKDMVYKDGFYLCPACLEKKTQNFMCDICSSQDVKLKTDL